MGIGREIVVYSNLPFKKYRWVSYVAVGQLGFTIVNLFVIPTPKLMNERLAKKAVAGNGDANQSQGSQTSEFIEEESNFTTDNNTVSFGQKIRKFNFGEIFSIDNIVGNVTGRPYFSGGLIISIGLITLGLVTRCRRAIHMITLLPEDRVRLSTFSPIALGKPPTIELPLAHVSCLQPRQADNNYSMLKLKGYIGVYLIDKSEGKFHEPKLFDQYLGYSRSWASR